MAKKKLYLLTQAFPLKQRESSFITPELPFLNEQFDVTVVPLEECSHSAFSRVTALIKSIFTPMLYTQVMAGLKLGKNPFKVFSFSLFMLWRARTYEAYLKKNVFTDKDALVYCYWYNEIALGALLLKKNHPGYSFITRCHGYDVYDFRVPGDFHPYKEYMDNQLDKIVFACNHAKQYYLERHHKTDSEKYPVCYLGVPPKELREIKKEDVLNIVSCSSVIPLKRVERIIEALSLTEGFSVNWHHFGDGSQMNQIKTLAKQLLAKDNISYTLHGYIPNAEYIQTLSGMNASLFVTASSTEGGVPVSISEAASFGMAVIATAVGGIPEIVSDKNGTLLSADPSAEELAQAIKNYYMLSWEEKQKKCRASYEKWNHSFNSNKNSEIFMEILKNL